MNQKRNNARREPLWSPLHTRLTGLQRFAAAIITAGLLAAPVLVSVEAAAQAGEQSYFYQNVDMKHYAMTEVETKDNYFTAGTVYNYPYVYAMPGGPTAITFSDGLHCMMLDNLGNPMYTNSLDDPNYHEHSVGVHMFNGNPVIVYGRVGGFDAGVGIVQLDNIGNITASDMVTSTQLNFEDLYPMGSFKFDDRTLFICGFAVQRAAAANLGTVKYSFILKYDVIGNKIVDKQFYESSSSPGNDFDIMMRMKRTKNDELWVGGSLNGNAQMMNAVIDPNNLSNIITQPNFYNPSLNAGTYEYSFDMMETGSDKFIFGNVYSVIPSPAAIDVLPNWLNITGVDATFNPYPGNNRWQFSTFDYAWGTNIIKDPDANTVVLGGMVSNRTCNSTPTTNIVDNINPFITRMRVVMTPSGISVTPFYWNTILSQVGTGNQSLSNSYFQEGGFLNNMTWGPVNLVRDNYSTTDMVLTSPVWNNSTNNLNMKFVRTDLNAELPTCEWAHDCGINGTLMQVVNGGGVIPLPFTLTQDFVTVPIVAPFRPDYTEDCGGHYRAGGVSNTAAATQKAGVAPNPATTEIKISWTAGTGKNTTLSVSDMMGKTVISKEFSQVEGDNNTTIDISGLAPGVYNYRIGQLSGLFVKE